MKYSDEVYSAVSKLYAERRKAAASEREKRVAALLSENAELAAVQKELSEASQNAFALLARGVSHDSIEKARAIGTVLFERRAEILAEMGAPQDAFEIKYHCPHCKDTGYVDGQVCVCLKNELSAAAYRLSRLGGSLSDKTFDNFSLEYYSDGKNGAAPSPRFIMERNLEICRRYAEGFSLDSDSLFMTGGVGLGKTHLASAIANTVLAKGFEVKYSAAPDLFGALERERFGRATPQEIEYLEPDLLIIDDLGSEIMSPMTRTFLFSILNSRMNAHKPTVVTTNLSPEDIESEYGDKVFSRVAGSFLLLSFKGEDVRLAKRRAESAR